MTRALNSTLSHLATAAFVIEADRIFDVQLLAWPVLALLAVAITVRLAIRRAH